MTVLQALPTGDDFGFLKATGSRHPPALRQECEAAASWVHRQEYHEDNPGGWLLVHVGNIMVREASEEQKLTAAAEAGASGSTSSTGEPTVGTRGRHVAMSFGGDNPRWARNLEVDFAAIAPLRLSWEIERVLMIGNRTGHIIHGTPDRAEPSEQEDEEEPDRAADAAPDGGVDAHDGRISPLSCLPGAVMLLVLEFSQPTMVRPQDGLDLGSGIAGGAQEEGGHWKVF